jgi:hypothetical protein
MGHGTGFLLALLVAAGAFAAGGAGCDTTSTLDSTAAGAGGTGGTAATSNGGAGGAAACKPGEAACMAPTDCPPTQNECVDATCTGGCCGTADVASMTPTATQTPGDCMEVVCDGKGGTLMIDDDTDVDDEMSPCVADTCSTGTPVRTPIAGPCTTNGGTVCGDPSGTNAGQCVQCNVPADCTTGACLANATCEAATCTDGTQDGAETDVDCGGSACPPCAPGKMCLAGTDCASGTCLLNNTCM